MKTFCNVGNQPCLIRFLVQSKYKKDSIIELNATTIENDIIKPLPNPNLKPNSEPDLRPESNFWKDNLKLILIISGSVLIFIIIIIIIVYSCIKKNNNKDLLAAQVNTVSFEEERTPIPDDGLLY